jgi:hypothetical protein
MPPLPGDTLMIVTDKERILGKTLAEVLKWPELR